MVLSSLGGLALVRVSVSGSGSHAEVPGEQTAGSDSPQLVLWPYGALFTDRSQTSPSTWRTLPQSL